MDFVKDSYGEESFEYLRELDSYGSGLLQRSDYTRAEEVLRSAIVIREKIDPDSWLLFNVQSMLGEALLGQEKYAEAEPLLVAGYEGMKEREATIPPQDAVRIPEALDRLIKLYTALDRPNDAQRYRDLRAAWPPADPGDVGSDKAAAPEDGE